MALATKRQRPRRPPGIIFCSTALVVLLFTVYSTSRPSFQHRSEAIPELHTWSLEKRDLECRLVHNAVDKCAFIRANCPDEEAGLISYLQLYYCRLAHAKPIAFAILVGWISLLFSTIGIAASDFLCINLSTIATVLGMSESLTGVTFLAFGNGSPDVFSTFAAMSTNSGSLAVGELMGAAGFITAVVAGSMALVKPFKVAKKSFVRDVSFFAVAASFSLVFLHDGSLRLWECAAMVAFYVFYVIFVVIWHWWLQRRRRVRLSEAAARLHHHIPDHQELEVPEIDVDEESEPAGERTSLLRADSGGSIPTLMTPGTPVWKLQIDTEDDETRDRYLAELQSNMRVNRPGRRDRRNTITPIRPSLVGALEFRSVLSSLEKKATSHQQAIGLRRYSDDNSEANDANRAMASQPELVGGSGIRKNTTSGRNRAVSANDAEGLRLSPSVLETSDSLIPGTNQFQVEPPATGSGHRHTQSHITGREIHSPRLLSPSPLLSPSQTPRSGESRSPTSAYAEHNGLLAPPPPSTTFHRPDYDESDETREMSPALSPNMDIPILQIPKPKQRQSPVTSQLGSPLSSPSHSRPPSIRLPPPSLSLSPESTRELALLQDDEEQHGEMRKYTWWPYQVLPAPQVLLATLFPTIYGWSDKSFLGKLFGLVTAPSVFLLTITLPVVETQDDGSEDEDDEIISPDDGRSRSTTLTQTYFDRMPNGTGEANLNGSGPTHPHGSGLVRRPSEYVKSPSIEEVSLAKSRNWNRWLVIVQLFTAPLFTVTIVWANLEAHSGKQLLLFILGSAVFSLICLFFILATTVPEKEPKFRTVFCFLGFAVAVAWISTIANEVVGVLKAFGVILNISDAILGLTIFAVGNSLGDLVADITVAKLGYPVMALSACFGGPMLNILLGVGIGGMYMTINRGQSQHHKHPDKPIKYKPYELEVNTTLMISGITLLVTLMGLLIVVPLNGWRMDRKIGIGLITLWSLSTLGNVICEILGIGSEWDSIIS